MALKRGRPRLNDENLIVNTILAHKEEVITVDKVPAPKSSRIWIQIADELSITHNKTITPNGIYTIVTNNRYGVRDRLRSPDPMQNSSISSTELSHNTSESFNDSSSNLTIVNITFNKSDLEDLIIEKQYSRSEKSRPNLPFRQFTVMRPGEWQLRVTEKLWETAKITCAYNFKRNKIFNQVVTITGKCNCGSTIDGKIMRLDLNNEANIMTCEISKGTGKCGKRILRNPQRMQVAQELWERNLAAEVYRADEANRLMSTGDPIPPHLSEAHVLRAAKREYGLALCMDKDPFISLALCQHASTYKNTIHNLALTPFYVHYWTSHQMNMYREHCIRGISSIAIDATGSIVRPIIKPSKEKSKHIFLYECVMQLPQETSISVAQMLSECQTTNCIAFWLAEWIRFGAPIPNEVTCDSSKALLGAVVRTFTSYQSVDEYAIKCWENDLAIRCYIRIDVAHFIKGYVNFLKNTPPLVKSFFMHCIGQLILAQSKKEAEDILFSVLAIAKSETEGHLPNGEETLSEIHKKKIQHIFSSSPSLVDDNTLNNEHIQGHPLEASDESNVWRVWFDTIEDKVSSEIRDNGDRVNAHCNFAFVKRLRNDVKWIPLWSCICYDKFGYGRIPVSSAAVEADFNNLKNRLFNSLNMPTRVDNFVTRHIDYLSGRLKVGEAVNAKNQIQKDREQRFVPSRSDMNDEFDEPERNPMDYTIISNSETTPTAQVRTDCEGKEGRCDEQMYMSCHRLESPIIDLNISDKPGNLDDSDSLLSKKIPFKTKDVTRSEENKENRRPPTNENSTDCPACNNGDKPTGAHACAVCKKSVHALDSCSKPWEKDDEGYGQKRICISCTSINKAQVTSIIECGEVENWRGLVVPSKKKTRYLEKRVTTNIFRTISKTCDVPILKNGGSPGLRAISIQGQKFTFTKTCGFDSVFQILLSAVLMDSTLQATIKTLSKTNSFLKLIIDTAKGGISKSTYCSRGRILYDLNEFPMISNAHTNCSLVDCEVTIGYLCKILLKKSGAGIQEISTCDKGCPPREKDFPVLQVMQNDLSNTNFGAAVERNFVLNDSRPCINDDCTGLEHTRIANIGPFIILELLDMRNNVRTALHDVPRHIRMSFMPTEYSLRGIVDLDPPKHLGHATRRSNPPSGHFTAMCPSRDGTWTVYNDLKNLEEKVPSTFASMIQVAIYSL